METRQAVVLAGAAAGCMLATTCAGVALGVVLLDKLREKEKPAGGMDVSQLQVLRELAACPQVSSIDLGAGGCKIALQPAGPQPLTLAAVGPARGGTSEAGRRARGLSKDVLRSPAQRHAVPSLLGEAPMSPLDDGVSVKEEDDDMLLPMSEAELESLRQTFEYFAPHGYMQCSDMQRLHAKLGEPITAQEAEELMKQIGFGATGQLNFKDFLRWWRESHAPDGRPMSNIGERYTQRFKVMAAKLGSATIRDVMTEEAGSVGSRAYRMYFYRQGPTAGAKKALISPWHNVELANPDGSFNFICEIPKWTRAKFEIATGEEGNPIKQDVKNGQLRFYTYGDMLFNYGAFPQTWEDPEHVNPDTQAPGDNDPLDVIELGTRQRPVGSITPVKILGIIGMIDSGETDWKVLTIAIDDDRADRISNLADLEAHMPNAVSCLTKWLRDYKMTEGKGPASFAFNGAAKEKEYAEMIIEETHQSWQQMLKKKLVV